MQINISGHHVEVTEALKDYVHSKVENWNDILITSPMFR